MGLAALYNAQSSRDDCMWIDTPDGGAMLTQTREWTEAHTKHLAASAEAARRDFNHRQRYPAQEAAE